MDLDDEAENLGLANRLKGGQKNATKANARPLGDKTNLPGKAIEEIYQKKTQLEHILLRPDTYIGSTEKQQQLLWVHDGEKLVCKPTTFVPGLYKIFDEILVNAADNRVRDATMDTLKVTIDANANLIRVWNNGAGIPVEVHKDEGVYVPELIFGHLLTSSNYNDQEKKITGGRNGYGAKLANIFSKEFEVETCDGKRQRRYKQVFRNNMSEKGAPKITACKASDNWTCISFKPDLAKFDMEHLEQDTVDLMRKRVYDIAGILGKGVKVFLNDVRLPLKSFQEYVDMYLGPKEDGVVRVYEKYGDRWEVCVSATDGMFQQVSFVNAICTHKGGTHVNHIVDQITKTLVEKINKKHKTANVKPYMVKSHLWVFINTQVENPAFDSQTKETLTTRATSFGSKCELSAAFVDKVGKCGVMDMILRSAAAKSNNELKKSDGAKRQRLTGIPKLDDANDAGGRGSHQCTLILTEGDSAKTLAISGLSVVGRDHYGVFPLRGKLLNVRDASASQISENAEIQNIKQILGLQHGKVYEDAKQLRYGHLMIMTDQDHDGSHIKGLIMNFLHHFYPSLLKIPGFLVEFITPIVKVSKGREKHTFYTMPEYEAWKESLGGNTTGWAIKYYKGLGTSTAQEAKEYFADLHYHRKEFVWLGDHEAEAIDMAFSKKKVEDRKRWLGQFTPGTYLDHSQHQISYSDFINKELILFSRADLERSIPSMVDGLKPGQRKIIFSCFKRNLKKDIKVAQLAGYVSEHSAYHHGEQSLASTIIGLAQDFVGSNNVNLLYPSGQFGTRLQGGKDAASPRYIFTRLAPLTRLLFNPADDKLLTYLNEEGQSIEPEWYMPILPLALVNGAEGIGTGWSTSIPNYNPRDIVDNLRRLMAGEEMRPMHPWYHGFNGTITEMASKNAGRAYTCCGVMTQATGNRFDITELPVRKWTQDYKEFLEVLVRPSKDKLDKAAEKAPDAPLLLDYKEHHTDTRVHFALEVAPDRAEALAAPGAAETLFKLSTKISTGNMMLFDAHGAIRRYDSPEHVLKDFYELRLAYYDRRRAALLKAAEADLLCISNKVRFILSVISGELKINNRKRAAIEADLTAMGFDRLANRAARRSAAAATTPADGSDSEADSNSIRPSTPEAASGGCSYDYLLSMALWNLTWERVEALRADAAAHQAEVARLRSTTAQQLWTDDLDAFIEAWDQLEVEKQREEQLVVKQRAGHKGAKAPAKNRAAPRKKVVMSSDDEGSSDGFADEESDDEYKPVKAKKPAKPTGLPKPSAAAAPAAPVPRLPVPAPSAPALPKPRGRGKIVATRPFVNDAPSIETSYAASGDTELAGIFQKMELKNPFSHAQSAPNAPRGGQQGASGSRAAAASHSDSEPEVMSPTVPPPKPRGRGRGRGAAADSDKAVKRKPRGPKVGREEIEVSSDGYDATAPSPAVARKGKVPKTTASPAVKVGMPGQPAAVAPTGRARRAPAKVYCEVSDDSDDAEAADDSDFQISD